MRPTATVRIVDPGDPNSFRVIDAAEFDPARHRLWDQRSVTPPKPVQAPRRHR
ncbi:MAG: hypothetical protein HQL39_15830 [Alphaproteobacteria bacterium]|nr:hypothetical protein [Alphaproteobacteria bacterium]